MKLSEQVSYIIKVYNACLGFLINIKILSRNTRQLDKKWGSRDSLTQMIRPGFTSRACDRGDILKDGCLNILTRTCKKGCQQNSLAEDRKSVLTNHLF